MKTIVLHALLSKQRSTNMTNILDTAG